MAISKVVFGDKTLLDLTEDTVTPDSVYEGYTFHSADGTSQVGARSVEGVVRYDVEQLLTDIQKAQARANIAVPTVPVISTDITADATSDTKTVSPKAVNTAISAVQKVISESITPDILTLENRATLRIPVVYNTDYSIDRPGFTYQDILDAKFYDACIYMTYNGEVYYATEVTDTLTTFSRAYAYVPAWGPKAAQSTTPYIYVEQFTIDSTLVVTYVGLLSVEDGAQYNQNAYDAITVGDTTIYASSQSDLITLAGSNVTLTPEVNLKKITFGITKDNVTAALGYTPPTQDTTYEHPISMPIEIPLGFYKTGFDTGGHLTSMEAVAKADITALGISPSNHTHTPAQIGASAAEHASTHTVGGSDPIDPLSIGAARDSDVETLANDLYMAINNHTHTLSSLGAASASVAVTASLYADNWERNLQAVSASDVTESNNIIVSPHPDYYSEYTSANIRAVSQSNGSVEFECDAVPSGLVEVSILIVG